MILVLAGTASAQIRIESNVAYDGLGWAVALVGDVNGDGLADSATSSGHRCSFDAEGQVSVYFGGSLSFAPDWTACGGARYAMLGSALGGAGDVDGDGYDDLIASRAGGDGEAWIFRGGPNGPSATPDWVLTLPSPVDAFGAEVEGVGDVDGDGYDDVMVGDPNTSWYGNPFPYDGASYLFLGSATGPSAAPDWTGSGLAPDDWYATEIAALGDVNADGYADVSVSAQQRDQGRGFVYVYYGSAAGLPASADRVMRGPVTGAAFGAAVDGAGDVNGDGYGDVVIGAFGYYSSLQDNIEGGAAVYLGSANGLAAAPVWAVQYDARSAGMGYAVAGAGDTDGDGFDDVLVGVPRGRERGGLPFPGKVELYRGSANGLPATPDWERYGDRANSLFGAAVAGGADTNGDGYADFGVGAPYYSSPETREGAAYFYLGP